MNDSNEISSANVCTESDGATGTLNLLPPKVFVPISDPTGAPIERTIPISRIVMLKELQLRMRTDKNIVEDYADAMERGVKFPPVVIFENPKSGELLLADGWHTTEGRKTQLLRKHQCTESDWVISATVRPGTKLDALLYAAGANAAHGLRRTNDDKRRAVTAILSVPEYRIKSNRAIAEICHVSDVFIGKVRDEIESKSNSSPSQKREGKDGIVRKIPAQNAVTLEQKSHSAVTLLKKVEGHVAGEQNPPLETANMVAVPSTALPQPVRPATCVIHAESESLSENSPATATIPVAQSCTPTSQPEPATQQSTPNEIWRTPDAANVVMVLVNDTIVFERGTSGISACTDAAAFLKAAEVIATARVDVEAEAEHEEAEE